MKKPLLYAYISAIAIGAGFLSACTQMPTEKRGVADIRPQISFQYERSDLGQAKVSIDGVELGVVGSFRAGTSALVLIPGTHQLRVTLGSNQILDERFYVADGVNKTFNLK